MKWTYSIVLVSIGVVSCTKEVPPVRKAVPRDTTITSEVKSETTEKPITQGKRKTSDNLRNIELTGIPVCEKSSMPGYSDGKALEAAIDGFNARGADIDKCNKDILDWAKKHGIKVTP